MDALERCDRPQVDKIDGVPPSIAINQSNSVKTSRSTVGTMTEINDCLKLIFARSAALFCGQCGEPVKARSAGDIAEEIVAWAQTQPQARLSICFAVLVPKNLERDVVLGGLSAQGFTHILEEESIENKSKRLWVAADRVRASRLTQSRAVEAVEKSLQLGKERVLCVYAQAEDGTLTKRRWVTDLTCPVCLHRYAAPTPSRFSFNSAVGACPTCRGFGRVIELDWKKVIPDETKTLAEGVFAPFSGEIYGESQRDLLRACRRMKIPTDVPWNALSEAQREFVLAGDEDWSDENWTRGWYGVRRFFSWLESTSYKMHVRVFLSRFRAYVKCPECGGTRFREESLCWKWRGNTLPALFAKTADELFALLSEALPPKRRGGGVPAPEEAALAETLNRLSFLREVGPGCLTLDRLRTAQARFADGSRVPETCVPAGKNSRTKKKGL